MRVLVTNDDGLASPGIEVLAAAAAGCGLEVTVAAPSWNASGASASLTAVEDNGRLVFSPYRMEGSDTACFSVEAAPAFIVRAALDGAFGEIPDMVLSGVNRGLNTGRTVLHSGTVGAALTATNAGLRSAAFSIDADRAEIHWSTAASVAERVIGWLCELEDPVALNVNVPNVSVSDLGELRRAGLASGGTVQTAVTEVGSDHHRIVPEGNGASFEPDSDAVLVAAGMATFSPLRPVCEDLEFDTRRLA